MTAENESKGGRGVDGDADRTSLEWRSAVRGSHPGDQRVRIARHREFRHAGPGILVPRRGVGEPKSGLGRVGLRLRRLLLGSPIPTANEAAERVNVPKGLAVFGSDNISSSAYATEEIMRALVLASVAALSLTLPLVFAILVVIAIVVVSDLTVIRTYPNGGGSYVVAKDNLGQLAGLAAAAALLTDYILTVAVSISAGVAAIGSAALALGFPALLEYRVPLGVTLIFVMVLLNLRGIQESGTLFAIPVYLYILSILALIGFGLFRLVTGTMPSYQPPAEWLTEYEPHALSLFLILRAFASGAVALTGAEAVSNGVPAFQRPEVRNAQITLVAMGTLFGTIFLGLSLLASQLHLVPDPHESETILSQLARTLTGTGWFYFLIQFATAILLVLAGNTAFNGFPRLAGLLAHDQYLPRFFKFRGERLAHTAGIIVLAVVAILLVVIYQASVTGLIPLYTVGVFLAFTLSQSGLVRRWWRERPTGWRWRLLANGVGTAATGTVLIVVGVTKFALGAWMVIILIPALIGMMWAIHRHYERLHRASQPETPLDPRDIRLRAIVPIANLELP
ncbi:MAG TPA: APC family permease, partial [Dehalococcoidia bacterium]|nr:APC family permease [Dehalococcoidia bacterium]